MSLSATLNLAQSSIMNTQFALNVVSNNISNMNTTGYSRQTAEFSSIQGYSTYNWASSGYNLKLGHGAEITAINRNRNQFLDNSYRDQNSKMGYYTQIGSMTTDVSSVMNELSGNGLQASLTSFYNAANKLSAEPTNSAYRISFAQAAKDVADQFNKMSSILTDARTQVVGVLGDTTSFENSKTNLSVEQINEKLAQLADLNGKIAQTTTQTGASNDLMDKRDLLLDELSSAMPIIVTQNSNNTVNVNLGNTTLVKGGEQLIKLDAQQGVDWDKPAIIQLTDMDGNVKKADANDMFTTGSLKALLDMGAASNDEGISYTSALNQLDKMANAFATELNRIQLETTTVVDSVQTPMSIDADGKLVQATEPIFDIPTPPDTFNASNIKVNQAILDNPNNIAAASVLVGTPTADLPLGYDPDTVGNNTNMANFIATQNSQIVPSDIPGGPSMSIEKYLEAMTTDIGTKAKNIDDRATSQQSVLKQVTNQRASAFGVNLDEELADLIKFQRSYEASARVFNVANQMLQIMTQLGQ